MTARADEVRARLCPMRVRFGAEWLVVTALSADGEPVRVRCENGLADCRAAEILNAMLASHHWRRRVRAAEARKKALAQERRTFARAVVGRRPRIESQEGIDIVMGHELTLECGYVLDWSRPTSPHRATCHQCREAAQ